LEVYRSSGRIFCRFVDTFELFQAKGTGEAEFVACTVAENTEFRRTGRYT